VDGILKKEKKNEQALLFIGKKAKQSSREELFRSYGEDRVVLLPVEPCCAHVYWDLDPERVKKKLPARSAQPLLRFYDITPGCSDEPSGFFDVEVDLRAGNWYVPLWSPGRSYVVELGMRNGRGRFLPLVRSNEAAFPPAHPSEETGTEYMLVMGDAEKGVFILREFEEPPELPGETAKEEMPEVRPAGEEVFKAIPPVPPLFFSADVSSFMQEREEEQRVEISGELPSLAERAGRGRSAAGGYRAEDLTIMAEASFSLTALSVPSGYERK
jgi:hypothetical protein